jgi:DNA-binding CsgD family transcriptional regulator/tetratricopeptide (TPR) repeat protein
VRRPETPFVGRGALLELFDEALDRVRQTRRVVVRLVGEAGIGKSRLLGEFARRGELLGLDVSWIDDASAGPQPAGPAAADPRDGGGSSGLSVVSAPSIHASMTPTRLFLVDLSARLDRLDELAALASDDEPSAPTVVFLAVSSVVGPLVPSAPRAFAALARRRMLHAIDVPPLDEAEIFELASHVFGGPPHGRLQQTISSLSEGNPWLAEEVAWDLQRVGLVGHRHGTPYLLGDVPESFVPSGIAAVSSAELDSIEPDVLRTLSSAAVLGRAIDFEVIASALPIPDDVVLRHLEQGLAYGILREPPDPSADFVFSRELVRRVLYRRLSRLRRRSLHQALAEALERVTGPTARPELSATLAYHFTRGRDPGRALDHVLRAQERAEHDRCWDDAIRYCREGLDLTRQARLAPVALQIDLLERLGALYFGQAETFATGACWREALQLCEQVGSVMRRAALTARLAALGPSWCSMEDAEAALRAALRSTGVDDGANATDAATWRFDAYHELGLAYQRLGRLPDAVEHLRKACRTVVPEDWPRRALARVSLASALISAGQPAEALGLLQAALATLDSGSIERRVSRHQVDHLRDPRRIRCLALGELVRALSYLGQLDEAAGLAETVVAAERQFGMLGGRGQRATAQVELARGRPDRALDVLAARLRQSAAGSLSAHRAADLWLLAEGYLAGGDADLALETATDGIAVCRRTGAAEHLAGLEGVMARALLARGEVEPALAAVAAARRTIAETGAEAHRSTVLAAEAACRTAVAVSALGPSPRSAPPAESRREHVRARTGARVGPRVEMARGGAGSLTAREREVLWLMADGRTNRQIAEVLILSEKTVKRHLSNMFAKLGVGTRAGAVRCAFQNGIF